MMSVGGTQGGLRTIWITIRAMNYATRVFDDIQRDIGKLMGIEIELAGVNRELVKSAMQFGVAGIMMATLSNRITMMMVDMAGASQEGAMEIAKLKQSMDETTRSLGATMFEVLKTTGILDTLNGALKTIRDNKALQILIAGGMVLIVVLTSLAAVTFIAWGALDGLLIIAGLGKFVFNVLSVALQTAQWSMTSLAISTGLAFGAFLLIYNILMGLDGPVRIAVAAIMILVGALVALWAIESAASLGIALVAGGVAAAGAVALASTFTQGNFQSGTRGVPKTGPIFAHKGEVVYNPATNRPLQVGNDLMKDTEGKGETNNFNIPITIENLHTKSDMDNVGVEMSKAFRKGMRGRK